MDGGLLKIKTLKSPINTSFFGKDSPIQQSDAFVERTSSILNTKKPILFRLKSVLGF